MQYLCKAILFHLLVHPQYDLPTPYHRAYVVVCLRRALLRFLGATNRGNSDLDMNDSSASSAT